MRTLFILTSLSLFFTASFSQTDKPIAVLQAKNMPIKVGAGAVVNPFYSQDANGYVAQNVAFPATGSYRFDVSAYSWYTGGTYSNLQIRIDGKSVGNITVNSLIPTVGIFSLLANVSSGTHQVAFALTNDGNGFNFKLYLGLIYITKTTSPKPYVYPAIAKQTLVKGQILNSQHFGSGILSGFMVGTGVLADPTSLQSMKDFKATGANIARWGLDVDRIPGTNNYKIRAGELAQLDTMVARGERYGYYMIPVLNILPNSTNQEYLGTELTNMNTEFVQRRASIIQLWKDLATHYKGRYGVGAYDLINEPRNHSNYADWINFSSKIVEAIRAIDPAHVIILEHSTGTNMFTMMIPYPYTNIVYSPHLYSPFEITHQGIMYPNRLDYPHNTTTLTYKVFTKTDLSNSVEDSRIFQRRWHLPIFIGEFSCIHWAPNYSADKWMGNAMEVLEKEKWSWTYLGFRMYEGWDPEIPKSTWYKYPYVNAKPQYKDETVVDVTRTSKTPAMDTLRKYFALNKAINTPPAVSITSPANNAIFTAPATINLTAQASDADGSISKVEFYSGSKLLSTDNSSPYTYSWTNVPAGSYIITAKATDNTGNVTMSKNIGISAVQKAISLVADTTLSINAISDLSMTDTSNKALAMQPNDAEKHTDEISFKLAPNPARNAVFVFANGLPRNSDLKISVLSMTGSVLKTINCKTSGRVIEVNISSLGRGMYILQASSGDAKKSSKFVKL